MLADAEVTISLAGKLMATKEWKMMMMMMMIFCRSGEGGGGWKS